MVEMAVKKTGSVPKLAFDHQEILDYALERLRNKVGYQPIGFKLLDKKFTMEEIHHLYEVIYGRKLDRRNFRKKFLMGQIIKQINLNHSRLLGRFLLISTLSSRHEDRL